MKSLAARTAVLFVACAALAACSSSQSLMPGSSQGTNYTAPARPAAMHPLAVTQADADAAAHVQYSYKIFPTIDRRAVRPNKTTVKYPADLKYYGGPLMTTARQHNIYVNCSTNDEKCWGDPEGFFKNLTGSSYAALLKQYTKSAPDTIGFADGTPVTFNMYNSNTLYLNDLFTILHAVVKATAATGYKDEYHIFLPKGMDTCFDGSYATQCYSPDNPSTWYFCAYHGAVKFKDISKQAVVYSVEPFQNVQGCAYQMPSKSYDPLTNSTDSTLAHETFESITDPNPTNSTLGWYNFPYNQEIADLCDAFPTKIKVGKLNLYLQMMYSNKVHGCADGP